MSIRSGRLRLAVVVDPPEEGWTSMDYVGEMLVATLRDRHAAEFDTSVLKPRLPRFFPRAPDAENWLSRNAKRFLSRCVVYPISIAHHRKSFDLFHIADHSYAHAAHGLPPARTGIYCHDLDALAPVFEESSAHPPWRHLLARSILRALQRVELVFYSTQQVRLRILQEGLFDDSKLVHAPYGIAPEFFAADSGSPEEATWRPPGPYLLHVGSGVPRKRLELLLKAFAALRTAHSDFELVQVGADLTAAQRRLIHQLGLVSCFFQPPRLSRTSLANLYHHASLVVLPSEREGFGLPVIEALACGAPVLASDIPAFREVGAAGVVYCDSSEPDPWREAIARLLASPDAAPPLAIRLAQAQRFSWAEHARVISLAYLALV